MIKIYYVYVMANEAWTLYIGVTNDLRRRVWEHQNNLVEGFTQKYQLKNLVYFEETSDVHSALEREKQLKKWSRTKKLALIQKTNPELKKSAKIFIHSA